MDKQAKQNNLINTLLFLGAIITFAMSLSINAGIINHFIDSEDEIERQRQYVIEQNQLANQLYYFRENYKLVFFYTSTCTYCHKFAPIFKKFVREHRLPVEAVTADGGKIRGFSGAKHSAELAQKMGIDSFPTVLVINKKTNNAEYVFGQGNMSLKDLEANLAYLLKQFTFT